MDPELRTTAPTQATGAVAFVRLEEISEDTTFRLREPGEVSDLAAAIGRLGQLSPIELRPLPGAGDGDPKWQVVTGFRRLEAIRMLQRERVLARVHHRLLDDDAWGLALSQALLSETLSLEELETLRQRLDSAGVATWAQELIDDAKARTPVAPELREQFLQFVAQLEQQKANAEPTEEEVTPEELAADLLERLSALNQDLALAFEIWDDLSPELRSQILAQARYVTELLPYFERKST